MTTQKEKEKQATNTREKEPRFANEVERLREAKRRALRIADERAKRANELEAREH